ncbi:unnamed protein product [Ceratitis capitata]|uniref:(Mediterranean fruit fly) hypothetical protein n=1 Tax=Ceratitis capitata TaxID=7213 RepID=A0A811VB19_CERCA|nr:unnamed protein product [Ceratitis capitata]
MDAGGIPVFQSASQAATAAQQQHQHQQQKHQQQQQQRQQHLTLQLQQQQHLQHHQLHHQQLHQQQSLGLHLQQHQQLQATQQQLHNVQQHQQIQVQHNQQQHQQTNSQQAQHSPYHATTAAAAGNGGGISSGSAGGTTGPTGTTATTVGGSGGMGGLIGATNNINGPSSANQTINQNSCGTETVPPKRQQMVDRLRRRIENYRRRQTDCVPRYEQTFNTVCEQQNHETAALQKRFLESKNKRAVKKTEKKPTETAVAAAAMMGNLQSSVHVASVRVVQLLIITQSDQEKNLKKP